jgi:LPXTG-motif cell wall-anchored protein
MRRRSEPFALCLVLGLLCYALTSMLQGCAVLSRPEWPTRPTIVSLDSLERAALTPTYVVISGKPKGPVIIQTAPNNTASVVRQAGPATAATAPAAAVQADARQTGGLTPYLVGAAGVLVVGLLGWLAFRRR